MGERLQNWAEGDDIPLFLARTWAEQTRRMLPEVEQLRKKHRELSHDYDRAYVGPSGYEVSEDMLNRAGRAVWAAECLLVVSAWNLDVWMSKVYKARKRKTRRQHVKLGQLRNAIMHLDEGEFDEEGSFVLAREGRSKHGLAALPDGRLSIGLSSDGKLLGILTPNEIAALASSLLDELNSEFEELWGNLVEFFRD